MTSQRQSPKQLESDGFNHKILVPTNDPDRIRRLLPLPWQVVVPTETLTSI